MKTLQLKQVLTYKIRVTNSTGTGYLCNLRKNDMTLATNVRDEDCITYKTLRGANNFIKRNLKQIKRLSLGDPKYVKVRAFRIVEDVVVESEPYVNNIDIANQVRTKHFSDIRAGVSEDSKVYACYTDNLERALQFFRYCVLRGGNIDAMRVTKNTMRSTRHLGDFIIIVNNEH